MIPTRILIQGGVVLAVLLGSGFVGYSWRDKSADKELAECQKTHAEAIATLLRAAQQAESDFRKQEEQITLKQQEAVNDALQQAESAKADATRVRAALERLRIRASASGGGSAPENPPATAASEAAGQTIHLPANVLQRLGEAAGQLAEYADAAAVAGKACELSYKAVETPKLGR